MCLPGLCAVAAPWTSPPLTPPMDTPLTSALANRPSIMLETSIGSMVTTVGATSGRRHAPLLPRAQGALRALDPLTLHPPASPRLLLPLQPHPALALAQSHTPDLHTPTLTRLAHGATGLAADQHRPLGKPHPLRRTPPALRRCAPVPCPSRRLIQHAPRSPRTRPCLRLDTRTNPWAIMRCGASSSTPIIVMVGGPRPSTAARGTIMTTTASRRAITSSLDLDEFKCMRNPCWPVANSSRPQHPYR